MNHVVTAPSVLLGSGQRAYNRRGSTGLLLACVTGDSLVIFLGLALSSWLRFATPLAHYGVAADSVRWLDYLGHAAGGTLLFVLLLPQAVYDPHRILRFRRVAPLLVKAAFAWLLLFMAFAWMVRDSREISRVYVVVAFVVTTLLLLGWRLMLTEVASCESISQRVRQRILFAGWSSAARSLAQTILSDGRHPYEIVGYVPLRDTQPRRDSPAVFLRTLGDRDSLGGLLTKHGIDMVVLGDISASTEETLALANLCEKEMVTFNVIPNCFQILLSGLRLQTVSGVPVLGLSSLPLDIPIHAMLKRLFDLVFASLSLVVSLPVILVFGALVYWESPGPILYRQCRLGRRGRPFQIYKIRSMRIDAETDGKVGWTTRHDPRRLRIGTFIRRWNIDELPQFWNVLKGDMSIVGPRPERPELIEIFKEEISHYNARHNIKPGMTGWAQVNGFRGDTDLNGRIRCDLYYIENWSLLLDLQIMAMTLVTASNAA